MKLIQFKTIKEQFMMKQDIELIMRIQEILNGIKLTQKQDIQMQLIIGQQDKK